MSKYNNIIEISSSSSFEEEEEEEEVSHEVEEDPSVLIEKAASAVSADWRTLYPPRDWGAAELEAPFSEEEIFSAIFDLGRYKSPNAADACPLCFFQAFWPVLKPDIVALFDDFYRGRTLLNFRAGHTRPLGVSRGVFRLVRKVLATRLRSKLHFIVDIAHTAFSKGQFIVDGVASAQAIIDSCFRNSWGALFIKLNFDKAYESIRWEFVMDALWTRGFGPRWINWINVCLLWEEEGQKCRGGLRAGDPLSSCLFVLATDIFMRMLWKARAAGLIRSTAGNLIWPNHLASLQYGSDVLILAPADQPSLVTLKLFLYLFELLSGLCINFDRSRVYSLSGDDDASGLAAKVLNCKVGSFPFIYLGMVLDSVEAKKAESDDDCYILDYDPFDTTTDEVKKKMSFTDECKSEDDEISILAEKGQVACRDYPHSRHSCAKYPFNKTPHESYCPQCYCYVCDAKAPCFYWKGLNLSHCEASDKESIWNYLRTSRQESRDSRAI